MKSFKIKKGHDLKLAGAPDKVFREVGRPRILRIEPPDFQGIKPKLVAKLDTEVKIGSPLFIDKLNPSVNFASPAGGKVTHIEFGERRRIERIEITLDTTEAHMVLKTYSASDLDSLSADAVRDHMLTSGIWPVIRQRPFSKVANPGSVPKAIFISAMPTAPFSPDMDFILSKNNEGFQSGLNLLAKLTSGKVNLVLPERCDNPALKNAKNVDIYSFSGPHPAGNVGIHIHHINPIRTGETVWYVSVQDVQAIGNLFLTGKLPVEKVISIGGSALSEKHYAKVRRGISFEDILKNNKVAEDSRLISGDVLTGRKSKLNSGLGYYDEQISVIPEGRQRHFMGWLSPGFKEYSLSNTFFTKVMGRKENILNTNFNGGKRAIIEFGNWENVLPMNILPTYLVKSILARDIEEMEKLGIYECDPEDFALCAFACTSKQEVAQIIRKGLDFIEKEG